MSTTTLVHIGERIKEILAPTESVLRIMHGYMCNTQRYREKKEKKKKTQTKKMLLVGGGYGVRSIVRME